MTPHPPPIPLTCYFGVREFKSGLRIYSPPSPPLPLKTPEI